MAIINQESGSREQNAGNVGDAGNILRTFPAMGIRKKMCWQFHFDFCRRKGQIWQLYDCKNFRQKFVIFDSVSTMQRYMINNISKNKH